jgi:hypothetical protein
VFSGSSKLLEELLASGAIARALAEAPAGHGTTGR